MSPSQNPTRPRAGRPPRPTTARGPRSGLALALALHLGVIGGALYRWSYTPPLSDIGHAVPVDLITVASVTNVAAQAPPPEKIDIPKPTLEPPALPDFVEAEPAPEPPLPKIKIKPDSSDEDTAKKPSAKDFAALLNKLTAAPAPVKNAKTASRAVQGVGAANMMTASLVDALRSQIARCWNVGVIAGGPNPADSVVDFAVQFNRDGTVGSLAMTPGTVARASANTYTRAAAEFASRAIYECQPYRLPAERYDEWREINPFHFDPRQMMNQ